jgi:pantoate--beta-alanine ligase
VLTVVLKLLHLTRPDVAFFGEKDYQQLALIKRMVHDLDLDTEIIGVPTVREADGLARSSRNRYLSPAERQSALAISAALRAASLAGPSGGSAALAAAQAVLDAEPGLDLDYLILTDPLLGPAPDSGEARLLIAAKVGTTRLIDNAPVLLGGV